MAFYIYENRQFKNRAQLTNPVGRALYTFFEWYVSTRQVYSDSLTGVEIHSQYRDNSPTHSLNKAVDFAVYPLWMNPFIYTLIHRYYKFNIYLSLHNRHIHIDNSTQKLINGQWVSWQNRKYLEVKKVPGDDRIDFLIPKKEFFTKTPPSHLNSNNMSIAHRYDFAELIPDIESIFAGFRLATSAKGRCVYAAYQEIDSYYALDRKLPVPSVDMVREYSRETGESIQNVVNDVRAIFDSSKLWLTIGGVLLAFYAIEKFSESGAGNNDNGKEKDADSENFLIE